jgi:hypothetical protein
MPRIPNCEYQDGGCDDPRCKIGLCILESEEIERRVASDKAEAEAVRLEIEAVIASLFSVRKVGKPTDAQLTRLRSDPRIIAEAKRRIAENAKLPKMRL